MIERSRASWPTPVARARAAATLDDLRAVELEVLGQAGTAHGELKKQVGGLEPDARRSRGPGPQRRPVAAIERGRGRRRRGELEADGAGGAARRPSAST